ncbi:hypothetical protein [Kitasatospora griseola]|uniref:hypothetical protein n=1 Tax=Kitasatospora griseola TaxID=2064 RepID=UPI003431421B
MEPGETVLAALRREPREEAGLALDADPPHGWHQEVACLRSAARRAARAPQRLVPDPRRVVPPPTVR